MKSQCSCCELQQSWLQGLYPVYSIASLVSDVSQSLRSAGCTQRRSHVGWIGLDITRKWLWLSEPATHSPDVMPDPVPCRLTLSSLHRTILIHAWDKAMRCQRAATIVRLQYPYVIPTRCLYNLLVIREKGWQFLFSEIGRGSLGLSISDYSTCWNSFWHALALQSPIPSGACCAGMATWRNEWFGENTPWSVGRLGYDRKVMVEFKPCRSLYRSDMNEWWKLYKIAEPWKRTNVLVRSYETRVDIIKRRTIGSKTYNEEKTKRI